MDLIRRLDTRNRADYPGSGPLNATQHPFRILTRHHALHSARTTPCFCSYAKDTGNFLSSAGREVGEQAKQAWNVASQKADELGSSAKTAAKDTGAFLSDAGREAGDKAKQAWDVTGQKAGELGSSAREAASNAAARGETLAKDAKDWTAGAVDSVKRGGEQAVTFAEETFDKVRDGVEEGDS
ncbi:hypothetical protein OSTOST_05784, partial [Ostertagia ostertagi]